MNKDLVDLLGSEKAAEGDWFAWFESRYDEATGEIIYDKPKEKAMEFCVRNTMAYWDELNKGRKKENKMVLNPSTRAMERVSYYPDLSPEEEKARNEGAWDYAIIAARKEEAPIELSKEDKLELIKRPKFLRYIKRVFEILDGEVIRTKEAAEKN